MGIDLRTGKRTLAAGGTVLAAGGGGVAWWLLRGDEAEAGGRPWEAEPLAHYDEGTAPSPLWGPMDLGSIGVPDARIPAPLPVRDLVVAPAEGGRLRAYDVRTGRARWTSRTAGLTGRPLAVSDDTDGPYGRQQGRAARVERPERQGAVEGACSGGGDPARRGRRGRLYSHPWG
ncbi:hypothetical protein SSPO_032690 [Streptomyces antimycoticus]|uniref:PQQ-binding-like beta-propeller repeat protein n=1 Tax=Streptomyces antimycoticus TaxID=68175 RepID=A0A499UTF8_9ACTN|nr:hypothetical protein SSPO_032690 [Streptomyces antimycoticus]